MNIFAALSPQKGKNVFFRGGGESLLYSCDSTLQDALLYEGVLELGAESLRLQAGKRTGNLPSGSHAR